MAAADLESLAAEDRHSPRCPLSRDPVQTQRRILRAARNEFMRHGYSGARIERISRAARSSDRMIYYYFASKEALYLQVLEGVYSELGEAESALVLDPSRPVEALDAADRLHLALLRRAPGVRRPAQQREPAARAATSPSR